MSITFSSTTRRATHVVIETLPYFGWYRDTDGTIGPGGSRLSDPRIRTIRWGLYPDMLDR